MSVDWQVVARAAAAHVFVEDLDAAAPSDADMHHLTRVLRVRPGETISVTDGAGRWLPATWRADSTLEASGPVVEVSAPSPAITVGLAVPKGDRAEWAVQKLAEVGVDRIVALVTERGVVRWDAGRAGRHLERWRAVARQAAMQSRRLHLPAIEGPRTVEEMLAGGDPVAMADPGGPALGIGTPTILIGPEGGWSATELGRAPTTAGLLPGVLRTETAAVVAVTLLAHLRAAAGDAQPGLEPSIDTLGGRQGV